MCSTPEKSHLAGLLVFAYDICNKLDDQTCLCFDVDEQFFRWVKLATSSTVKNTRRRRTGTHGDFFSPKKLRNQIMCKVRAGDICSLWRHGQPCVCGRVRRVLTWERRARRGWSGKPPSTSPERTGQMWPMPDAVQKQLPSWEAHQGETWQPRTAGIQQVMSILRKSLQGDGDSGTPHDAVLFTAP